MGHERIGMVMLLVFFHFVVWAAWKNKEFRREVVYPLIAVLAISAYIWGALTLLGI